MRALETDRIVNPLIVSGARSHVYGFLKQQYGTDLWWRIDPDADPCRFGERNRIIA